MASKNWNSSKISPAACPIPPLPAINIFDFIKNKLIKVTSSNQYTGAINTNGNWVLVTLDLTGVDLNKTATGTLFSIKVGKDTAYNLLIDNIVVW